MIASLIAYAMAAYCLAHAFIFAGAGISFMVEKDEENAVYWMFSLFMAVVIGMVAWLFAYLGTVAA